MVITRQRSPFVTTAHDPAVGLLERALGYALGSLQSVTAQALSWPTPCRAWNVAALLDHVDESLASLHEAVVIGHVGLGADPNGPAEIDPVARLRMRACTLLGAAAGSEDTTVVSVGDEELPRGMMYGVGALEVAVHAWDLALACGTRRPIPPELAQALLPVASLVVTDADRPARFAAPVDVAASADQASRLLAFLGRHPN